MTALLVACGGGGAAPPAAGGGVATAQSFASGPISGLGSIIVNGVRFDDSMARIENAEDDSADHHAGELKLGMMVEVQAGRIDDSTARATASLIRFGSEMVGPVASKDDVTQTLRVLDQTVEVKPSTVFDESLAGFAAITPGQILEIHALFDASTGHYVATRIEPQAGAAVFRLRGLVSALTATTFKIGDAVIDFSAIAPADLPAALADGQRVRVRLQTAHVEGAPWVAISVRTGVRRVDDMGDARMRGMVTAFTSPQQFEIQGVAVDATHASFEPNADAVKPGALVEVRGQASAGKIVATRVRVLSLDGDDWRMVELHGSVSALDTTGKTFMLRDVKVDYSRMMVMWKNGQPADLADPVKSLQVEVKGMWSADHSVLIAAVVAFE